MEIQSHLSTLVLGPEHVTVCVPVYEMRRCEFAMFDTSACQERGCIVAYGSFAVGASNVYRLPRKANIFQELGNPLQAGLDHDHGILLW